MLQLQSSFATKPLTMQKRRFIVLSGEKEQRFRVAQQLVKMLPVQHLLWFTKAPASRLEGMVTHTVNQVLGREHSVVIFDAFSGFNPDAFAALAGTIKAGGILILLSPPLATWHAKNDPFTQRLTSWPYKRADVSGRFIRYFVSHLLQADFIECFSFADVECVKRIKCLVKTPVLSDKKQALPLPNAEQKIVIAAIKRIALCKSATALVVEADRGRGKSAALGMAVAQLMQMSSVNLQIIVIAPTLKTVDVLFHHAQQVLTNQQEKVRYSQGQLALVTASATVALRFVAPDVAIQKLPDADLVLIDEAAAIPSSLLVCYLKQYPRLIFATTVHGYEGTGRGFALRFCHYLDQYRFQHWQTLRLQQAIRYQAYDPLETFIFRSLLLAIPSLETPLESMPCTTAFTLNACMIQRLDRDALVTNIPLLEALFGLLLLAHYQTRPSDLRHLLEGKGVSIYAVFWRQAVVAVCLTVREGGFDAELAEAIYYGKRRPQGHLVAQSLAFHAGLADAPLLITERVMRIVVHPALQRRGIASYLLARLGKRFEQQGGVDYLSTSFAATKPMLVFWCKQGFKAVHMGLKRDASSGCHSLIMIKPLSNKGKHLLTIAQQQFYLHLPILLEDTLKAVETEVVKGLLQTREPQIITWVEQQQQDKALSVFDWADLQSFAYGHRGYTFCLYAIRKWVQLARIHTFLATLPNHQQQLLQLMVVERQSVETVKSVLKLTGKKAVDKQLRCAVKNLLLNEML